MNLDIINTSGISPFKMAVAAATTCYSAAGKTIPPDNGAVTEKEIKLVHNLFSAGHHTTLMHSHITLRIDGISRLLVWRLLHSHPYYNTEQVSQRYTQFTNDQLPNRAIDIEYFNKHLEMLMSVYAELVDKLTVYYQTTLPKNKIDMAVKRAQEHARYVLPAGGKCSLYHTVDIMTAVRYISAAKAVPECKSEALEFSSLLIAALLDKFPEMENMIEACAETVTSFATINKLRIPDNTVHVTSADYLNLSEQKCMSIISNYASTARPYVIAHDLLTTRGFNTVARRSIVSDMQHQRHRSISGCRPKIIDNYQSNNWYVPSVIERDNALRTIYNDAIKRTYEILDMVIEHNGKDNVTEIFELLPNAHYIDVHERYNYADFAHMAQLRMCRTSQEEIHNTIVAIKEQLSDELCSSYILDFFTEPCVLRNKAGVKPTCPEGNRACGHNVWLHPEMSGTKIFD